MTETTNYGLHLTDDSSERFMDWRNKINGTNNSNMTKIDETLADKADANHTHPVATQAANGLMSAEDKTKLDNLQNHSEDFAPIKHTHAVATETQDGFMSAADYEKVASMLIPPIENTFFAVPGKNGDNIVKVTDDGETAEFSLRDKLNLGEYNLVGGYGSSVIGRQSIAIPGVCCNITEINSNVITLDTYVYKDSINYEVILCATTNVLIPKRLKILDVSEDGYSITVEAEENINTRYKYAVIPTKAGASGTYLYSNHAEGSKNIACGRTGSHAEGFKTIASGEATHAENMLTEAKGDHSHAEGYGTKASSQCQHVQGQYNIEDAGDNYADIVGNGADENARSNAYTLDWQGNGWFAGDVESATAGKLSEKAAINHTHENYAPSYTSGTEDLEAGVSSLATGTLHFVYE